MYPEDPQTVDEHLRKLRMDRGLYQRELAAKLGVHESTVRGWERGAHRPSAEHRKRLVEVLGPSPPEEEE